MHFQISDKVVCVDASIRNPEQSYRRVVKGQVYVICDVWIDENALEGWLVQLVGFDECYNSSGVRMGWTPSRFRKLADIQAASRSETLHVECVS
jgi:hypothetical protein